MLRFMLCAVLLTGLAVTQEMFEDKTYAMTARCRAQCLNKFHVDESGKTCINSNDCRMCWDTCHLFYKDFKAWRSMCDEKHLRLDGSQEACGFYNSHSDIIEATRMDTHFTQPLEYTYKAEDDSIHLKWSRPKGNDQVDPLVYVLMIQEQVASHWEQLEQTIYHNATIQRQLLKPSSWIRLTAYDSNGKVAQIEKSCSEFNFNGGIDGSEEMFRDEESVNERTHHQNEETSADYVDYYEEWVPILNTLRYSTQNPGGVDTVITWPRISYKADIKYEVEWKHSNDSIDITGHLYTNNNLVTITLWPNSIYQVTLRAFGPSSHRAIALSRSLYVDTAGDVSGTHPLFQNCPGCIPVEYFAGLAVGVAVIAFVIAVALIFIRLCHQDLQVRQIAQVSSACEHTKLPTYVKRTSLKKQLSSINNLISAIKHEESLINNEGNFSYGKSSLPDNINLCNV